jgi:hypothetical protein
MRIGDRLVHGLSVDRILLAEERDTRSTIRARGESPWSSTRWR